MFLNFAFILIQPYLSSVIFFALFYSNLLLHVHSLTFLLNSQLLALQFANRNWGIFPLFGLIPLVESSGFCLKSINNNKKFRHSNYSPLLEEENEKSPDLCPICLEPFPTKESIFNRSMHRKQFHYITLPVDQFEESRHYFHQKCLSRYEKSVEEDERILCPLCRQPQNNTGPNEVLFWYAYHEEIIEQLQQDLAIILSKVSFHGLERTLLECSVKGRWERARKIIEAAQWAGRIFLYKSVLEKLIEKSGGFSSEQLLSGGERNNFGQIYFEFSSFEDSIKMHTKHLHKMGKEVKEAEREAFDFLIGLNEDFNKALTFFEIDEKLMREICWIHFKEDSSLDFYSFLKFEQNAQIYLKIFCSNLIEETVKEMLGQKISAYFEADSPLLWAIQQQINFEIYPSKAKCEKLKFNSVTIQ
jgi:hypothetical protein